MKQVNEVVEKYKGMRFLKFMIMETVTPRGEVVSLFEIDGVSLGEGALDTPEAAYGRFYYVGEHTCPVNILSVKEVYVGSDNDQHGIIRLIGYIPENVLRDIGLDIFDQRMDSTLLNEVIRVYKSVYHLILSSRHLTDYAGCGLSEAFGKPFYLEDFGPKLASRVNYLVIEILKQFDKLPSRYQASSYVIDANNGSSEFANQEFDNRTVGFSGLLQEEMQKSALPDWALTVEDDISTILNKSDYYNGLIGGFPEAIFRDDFIGIEKFKDIIFLYRDCEWLNSHTVDDYVEAYYEGVTRINP